MGETKPRDIIRHASSTADSDQEFTHTIKHGNKIQAITLRTMFVEI